mmetsp:Transcript_5378/g.12303  ORF Transcript_5378/g.12303 Transcript_5378/m.12303 type:complete len:276 (+) Transcript_5378:424-1251(+)
MTTIRYFVPEDGDLETQPNVFLAPKPRHPGAPPTFGQVRDAFPLPGQYHFRFKSALVPGTDRDKSAMAVWMDVVEERQPVPTWKNGIVVKVARISMEDDDDDEDDDDEDFHRAPAVSPPAPAQAARPSHAPAPSAGSIDDLFGSPAPPPAAHSGNSGGGAASLLDFNDHHHTPAPQPAVAPSSAHNDFFGMTAHPPAPQGVQSAPASGGYHGNPNVYAQQQQQQQQQQQHMQQHTPVQRHMQPPPQQQQQQQFNSFSSGGAPQQGAFGGLGTPWK